jgi:hypothetical protein
LVGRISLNCTKSKTSCHVPPPGFVASYRVKNIPLLSFKKSSYSLMQHFPKFTWLGTGFSSIIFCGPSRVCMHACMYVCIYACKLPIDRPWIDRVAASPCRFFMRRDVSQLLIDDLNTRHNVFRALFDDLNRWRDIFLMLFNDSNTGSDGFWVSFDVHATRCFCGWTVCTDFPCTSNSKSARYIKSLLY